MKVTFVPFLLLFLLSANVVADGGFKVFSVKGSANIKKKDGTWRKINTDTIVEKGDEIKTDSKTKLVLFSKSKAQESKITLKEESGLVCEEEGSEKKIPTFNLKKGSAFCSVVSKIKKKGVTFKIKTEVGVAGVTGTEFSVTNNQNGMKVAVSESTVELVDHHGRKARLAPNNAGYIQSWERAKFTAQGSGISPTPAKEMETTQMLTVSFPAGLDESEMFSEAQYQFMTAVERLIEGTQDPEEKKRLRSMDRVQLFRDLLPLIQKEDLGNQVNLKMSLQPVLASLGLPNQIQVVSEVQQIDKVAYSKLYGSRNRLMVERAAKIDGYRQLAELINGVVVSSETNVKDFVAENDAAAAQLDAFIRGAAVRDYEYFSDGMILSNVFIDPDVTRNELKNILKKPMGKTMLRSSRGLSAEDLRGLR